MPDDSVSYEGLSVRDKARQAVKEMGETGQIMKAAWMMEIEKALQAQIEDCADLAEAELDEYWWRGRVGAAIRALSQEVKS